MKRRVMLLIGAIALALAMFGGVALAETVRCSTDPCKGTQEDDQIFGTADAETIEALGGDDIVDGLGGNDKVYGGDGRDRLTPAEDSDEAYGGPGNDTINLDIADTPGSEDFGFGGRGNDTITASDGNKDIIDCGEGKRDEVTFDKGLDTIKNCEIKNPVTATTSSAAGTSDDTDSSQRQR